MPLQNKLGKELLMLSEKHYNSAKKNIGLNPDLVRQLLVTDVRGKLLNPAVTFSFLTNETEVIISTGLFSSLESLGEGKSICCLFRLLAEFSSLWLLRLRSPISLLSID